MSRLARFTAVPLLALVATLALIAPSASAQASRYEAEDAACEGTVDSNYAGFSGRGFCNTPNRVGARMEFTVHAETAGTLTLGVKYANGSTAARPADLSVNGALVRSAVAFEPIGAWSSWAVENLTVPVRAGANTVRLTAATAGGLANIDYLDTARAGDSALPPNLQWNSSGPLVFPKSDATHNIVSVKDPSVVYHNGRYHVFVSVVSANQGYSLAYLSFTDWSQAGSAPLRFLDTTAIGTGYKAAPQVFYFAPQQRWYLTYQIGDNVAYSTTANIADPASWSAPKPFYAGTPQIVLDNMGEGQWLDFWTICDSANCHMYSSDDNGNLYRAQTSLARFPNGFSEPVIAMHDPNHHWLFEGANVYRLAGENEYLLMVEAITAGGRIFRSWTSSNVSGPWTPLADTKENPFASRSNVTFDGTAWTNDISHGELIRGGVDQTLTVSPCDLRFLYQGKDPDVSAPYNLLPWRLGLLTQTNSPC
ncbi:non-reducing end alpha-L-arabinofuranosidase family hydrolase [Glycomyces luteolus]|uniref:non-reducing end alpha-L-arabinofuranosidase n=1 Tax=Glycomyces luteolus TaxID=2670330 RepID=A0A9X3P757_9ACTN|nr:non-reducing end alpha-L-arabinofuranosidase family hydrolase [Glycomyces luteolus]MDA1358397.1 non-reducing end alpha-L-arabinofuranosidase family hydrolase [Glycomyces luteolus]